MNVESLGSVLKWVDLLNYSQRNELGTYLLHIIDHIIGRITKRVLKYVMGIPYNSQSYNQGKDRDFIHTSPVWRILSQVQSKISAADAATICQLSQALGPVYRRMFSQLGLMGQGGNKRDRRIMRQEGNAAAHRFQSLLTVALFQSGLCCDKEERRKILEVCGLPKDLSTLNDFTSK
jgi:hypothetical protein